VIVPALAIGLSFGMREAMGTSMVIIALASTCALAGHLVAAGDFEPAVAATMGAAAIAGAVAGPCLAARIPERSLGRSFAALVAAVSVGVMAAALAGT
jgi:uncharacterized protein